MPLALQPKLLRALQERKVRPVGGESRGRRSTCAWSPRRTAISRRWSRTSAFREDLYYRINVIHIALPPLRARGGDVLLLAQHFLRQYAAVFDKKVVGLSPAAAERLARVRLAGQRARARELHRARGRARALRGDPGRGPAREDAQSSDRRVDRTRGNELPELLTLEEVERRYILRVLEACHGNRTDAAKILGLDRKTLYRKLLRWGVSD